MKSNGLRILSLLLTVALLVNILLTKSFAANSELSADSTVTDANTSDLEVNVKPETLEIVSEIVENRTQYSKDYQLNNGLRMSVIYGDAVHYEKDGQWADIDNTLALSGGAYTNTAGPWTVSFPQQLTDKKSVAITKDGYTLSFYMSGEVRSNTGGLETASISALGADEITVQAVSTSVAQIQTIDLTMIKESAQFTQTVPEKLQSRLQYSNVFSGTDVVYDLNSDQVKESIVMQAYSAGLRGYRYALNVGTMIPVLADNGEIWLFDSSRKNVVMVMPAPFLVDNAGEYCDDVQVSLTGSGSTYTLTYTLPQLWLASSERQWPVVLDPVVDADTTRSNIGDISVYELGSNYHYLSGILDVGHNTSYGIMRTFLKYDNLPALTSADVIVDAKLTLYKPNNHSTTNPVEVHKVTTTWESEGMVWDTQPDYVENVEDHTVVKDSGYYYWNIVDVVRGWYEGENTGLMLKAPQWVETTSSTSSYRKQFYSSDYGILYHPLLTITYRNNSGLEGYWDYTTSSAGRAGTGYVNDFTGNLVWVHSDIGYGGNRMPVAISHIYNSNDINSVGFGMGYGWRTNFNQKIFTKELYREVNGTMSAKDYYAWTDSDGTTHYFIATEEEDVFVDEDGLRLKLTLTEEETTANQDEESFAFVLEDINGNKSYFDTAGRLRVQENNQAAPSTIIITYVGDSDLISRIDDGVNRHYHFIYTDGLLSRIRYTGSGTTEVGFIGFSYTDGNLTKISYQDNEEIHYGYGLVSSQAKEGQTLYTRLLTSVQDIDGYLLRYNYYPVRDEQWQPYRVSSVSEHDGETTGGTLTIQYGHNQTVFTDGKGRQQIKQFNSWGNTTAIQDHEGRAQFLEYERNEADKNGSQLTVASRLQSSVGNMLHEISFESSNPWTTINSAVTVSRTTGSYFLGDRSLKITRSAAGDPSGVYGISFTVQPGESYTLSSYIKTGSGADAFLAIAVDGVVVASSDVVPASTKWLRKEVSYTNTGDTAVTARPQLMSTAKGTCYFDCVQLEKAPTASRYNRVENGDFHMGSQSWTKSSDCTGDDTAVTLTGGKCPAAQLESTAFKIVGDGMRQKRISQTVKASGSKDTVYVIAGWAKGNSVSLADDNGTYQPTFGIRATFVNTDGTETPRYFPFNPDMGDDVWQYTAGVMVAKKAFSAVRIEVLYEYNANTVYFDGIQAYKEDFGSSYTYDADGNVVKVVDLQKQQTSYQYQNNDLTKIIQNGKAKMTYEYDEYHNVTKATSAEGLVYEFDYDDWGNNTSVTIAYGNKSITSRAGYSADGNCLVYTKDALEKQTNYCYNVNTNVLEWVQYPEDSEDSRTEYTYDEMYRIKTAVQELAEDTVLTATYTYTDDQLTAIQTGSTTYSFGYGKFAQRQIVKVGNRELAEYRYTDDPDRFLSSMTYGNNDSITYTYDGMGRVVKETFEDGSTVTYEYDNDGALATVTDSETGRKITYYYDLTDRLVKYVESGDNYAHSVGYEYDTLNNLTKLVETINGVDHTTEYTYDDDNRVAAVNNGDLSEAYTYDGYGRITQKITKFVGTAVITETFTYKDSGAEATSGQLATHTTAWSGGSVTYSYTYDDNGNILTVSDGTNTTTYTYDAANQLAREDNQATDRSLTWSYDSAGNILSRNEYAYTVGELGSAIDTVTYTYGDADWGDLLTGYDGNVITYDNIGNPLSDGTWTYNWKHGRQLASMSDGVTTWTYTYDANGMRTKRTNGTTTYEYVYNGSQLVQLTKGTETLYFTYDASGTPQTVTISGTVFYYITNSQGDVIGIRGADGVDYAGYTYDAWGNIILSFNRTWGSGNRYVYIGDLNPLRYRGYVYDHETGLYYLQSRYYDPEIGRFLNADAYASTGQGVLSNNMLCYCLNSPINAYDPNGMISFWDITDIAFAIASWVDLVVEPSWENAGSALLDTVGLLPIIPSLGGIKRGANLLDGGVDAIKAVDKGSDAARAAQKGWSLGDDITALTKAGKEPSWTTVRKRYWKNEAYFNPELYSPYDLSQMRLGFAPLVSLNGKLYPMELHHITPRRNGGSNAIDNLIALTPWDHAAIDKYRNFLP